MARTERKLPVHVDLSYWDRPWQVHNMAHTTKGDNFFMRKQTRARRHSDRVTLRAIAAGRIDPDAAVYSLYRRDVYAWPSW